MRKINNSEVVHRIHMELQPGDNYHSPYYIDVNGFLKGEWGGYDKILDLGPDGEAQFEIYYDRFSKRILISEYGYFYNKFSCEKFDAVLKLTPNIYLCEKNERLGLIDDNGKTILHTSFNNIEPFLDFDDELLFIVTTETGKFLYNYTRKRESEVFEDIHIFNQIIYKSNQMYGILDKNGNMLTEAIYIKPKCDTRLLYLFQDMYFQVTFKDDKYYGNFSTKEFDNCLRIGSYNFGNYYFLVEKDGKYGLFTSYAKLICEPILDEIILYKFKKYSCYGCFRTILEDEETNKWYDVIFIIARLGNKYKLFNAQDGSCIIDDCDSIEYEASYYRNGNAYISFKKSGNVGYVSSCGIILSKEDYDDIHYALGYFFIEKKQKHGLLSESGFEIVPCEYDKILVNCGTGEIEVEKDGEKKKLSYRNKKSKSHSFYERPTYEKYSGSYAQDEAGYSDDDIDTVFDGDPSAYWNID